MNLKNGFYANVVDSKPYMEARPFNGMTPDEYCRQTYPRTLHLMRVILRDSEEARDATQEAYMRMWKSRKQYRSISGFDNWVKRISVNVAREFLRKKRRQMSYLETTNPQDTADPSLDVQFDARIDANRLKQVLSHADREALVYFYENGMTHRELGHVLGITENAARSRVFDARRRARILIFKTKDD